MNTSPGRGGRPSFGNDFCRPFSSKPASGVPNRKGTPLVIHAGIIYCLSSTAGGGKYPDSPVVLFSQSPTFSMGPSAATKALVTPSFEGDPVLGDCTLFAARTSRLPPKGKQHAGR